MKFTPTPIAGSYVVELEQRSDDRGYFARAFCTKEFEDAGISFPISQINMSGCKFSGTIRGMHYQIAPHGEAKYMRCIRGEIFDVVIDMRSDSPTYKQWFGVRLSSENKKAFVIPEGCAHGYQALENDTEVIYATSSPYEPTAEHGVRFDDPSIGIDWPIKNSISVSAKDAAWENM